MIVYDRLYVGGQWITPAKPELVEVRSPHDGSLVGAAVEATPADVDIAVAAARKAFDHGPWPRMSPAQRLHHVARFAALHAACAEEIADLTTAESGSPRWFSGWTMAAVPEQVRAFLRAAESCAWEQSLPSSPGAWTLVRAEPVGVVAAVVPWSTPHSSALAKVLPALLAGCTVVLKASPETALVMLRLGELFTEAGIPEGVVSVLPADRGTSEYLVSHWGVDKIAFTGSTDVGRRIGSIAGRLLKRVTLELGGKSAAIALEDADLDALTQGLRFDAFANSGQVCVAHSRLLVHRSRYEEALARLKDLVESFTIGDPSDPGNFIGPMVRPGQQQRVRRYIDLGLAEGARLVAGGSDVPPGLAGGCYVRPTLFADVDNSLRIAQEEIYGPVLAVIPFRDDEEGVAIANDSPYGLGGGVWTAEREHGLDIARRIRTGVFSVNGARTSLDGPFGGFKASGVGREFGHVGLAEYVEYKTVSL